MVDVENIDYIDMAESLDIGTIINKKAIAASRIYQLMLDADVMNVTFLMSANADVAEFVAKNGARITTQPVKDTLASSRRDHRRSGARRQRHAGIGQHTHPAR